MNQEKYFGSKFYIVLFLSIFLYIFFNFRAQEEESRLLQGQLDIVAEDIMQLQGKQATLLANLHECKRRQIQMAHTVLKVLY